MNVTYILKSGTIWRVPPDASLIQVECFGPSSQVPGEYGGAGGSYSKSYRVKVKPGGVAYYNIGTFGALGSNTWFNTSSFSQPDSSSNTTNSCLAISGGYLYTGSYISFSKIGQVNDCIGDIKHAGGLNSSGPYNSYAYALGGQAGPNGPGGDASFLQFRYYYPSPPNAPGTNGDFTVLGGGGANAGTDSIASNTSPYIITASPRPGATGGSGGYSYFYPDGTGRIGYNITGYSLFGTTDTIYTDYFGNTAGPKGGDIVEAYCCNDATYYRYTQGPSGFIVITIINPKPMITTYVERFDPGRNGDGYGYYLALRGTARVPVGTTNILIEGIGAGGRGTIGATGITTIGSNWVYGGGGGGYANSNITMAIKDYRKGGTFYYNVPSSITDYAAGQGGTNYPLTRSRMQLSNTWVNIVANSQPTSATGNIVAMSAYSSAGGGSGNTGINIGGNTAIGGNGGFGMSVFSSSIKKGGGGGGAAYIFNGGNGGNTFSFTTTTAYPGGGGGAAGGILGVGNTGGTGTATVGGRGGNTAFTIGGVGGTSTSGYGGGGDFGAGGGGSGLKSSVFGGDAGVYNVASWYDSTTGTIYGPSGGGGGGGSSATVSGQGGWSRYGGGSGAGDYSGTPGTGLLIVTYTLDTNYSPYGYANNSGPENCYGYIIE